MIIVAVQEVIGRKRGGWGRVFEPPDVYGFLI